MKKTATRYILESVGTICPLQSLTPPLILYGLLAEVDRKVRAMTFIAMTVGIVERRREIWGALTDIHVSRRSLRRSLEEILQVLISPVCRADGYLERKKRFYSEEDNPRRNYLGVLGTAF